MESDYFTIPVSQAIWTAKYRQPGENSVRDTWHRVASALASVEKKDRAIWQQRFYKALEDFRFLPGGRILAGAGTAKRVTLFNCFAMGTLEDSMDGIFDALKEGAITMQQGGGVGYDFSTLRPQGTEAHSVGGIASGPVSFMRIWDSMCATLLSTGARRGAMMATLRCDHPDIETFVEAKRDPRELRNFNLSVLVTDEFMQALERDEDWPLVFPLEPLNEQKQIDSQSVILRRWSAAPEPVPCKIFHVLGARELWQKIMRATYDYAEPGVLYIDRINRENNLWYREQICTTNPCGEIPLPPYGACNLGSINLTRFVSQPFTSNAHLDREGFQALAAIAVRMLDNVIDLSRFPLEQQKQRAQGTRRIGLGITGLADALIMLGIRYGEKASYQLAAELMQSLCHTAYQASIDLAREKGAFPCLEKEKYLKGPFIQSLPDQVKEAISQYGVRNSHLIAVAPTGSISLLANNVSNGLEPVYDFQYKRRVLTGQGTFEEYKLTDHALLLWREHYGSHPLSSTFVTIRDLPPLDHLNMQAAIQPFVDNAISKTINVPEEFAFASFESLYQSAFELGLKGCTTFRSNPVTGAVLVSEQPEAAHCCTIEREGD